MAYVIAYIFRLLNELLLGLCLPPELSAILLVVTHERT
jgi:hypothetical protein